MPGSHLSASSDAGGGPPAEAPAAAPERPGGTAGPVTGERAIRLALLAAGLAAAVAYTAVEIYLLAAPPGFPLDDSWIHLQLARNLSRGSGLSLVPGELVAASTAPLWTALLALVFLLPAGQLLAVKALGVALYLAAVDATWRLARELGLRRTGSALAAGLTLATSWMVWSALSGLEVPLFAALGLWGMVLHVRERRRRAAPPLSAAVLAVATLARPEGIVLLVLAMADRAIVWRRDAEGRLGARLAADRGLALALGLAALALVPLVAFNLAIGGSALPTTFAAKTDGVRRLAPDLRYLYEALGIFFRSQPYMVLLAGGGVVALARRLGTGRDRGLLPAAWLCGLPLAYSLLGSFGGSAVKGNFGRYLFPLFPLLVVVGLLGLAPLAAAIPRGPRLAGFRLPVRWVLAALLLWPTLSSLASGAGLYVRNVANVRQSDIAMATWLAQRLPPEAVLAVNDVGALSFFLPNPILDLAGIAHPEVPRYIGEAQDRGEVWFAGIERFLRERRPDYLVVFPEWYPGLRRGGSPYRPVHALEIPHNITMGGDTLAVFTTPWTRYPLRDPDAAAPPPGGDER